MATIDEIMKLVDDMEDMAIIHHDGEVLEPIPQRAALREIIAASIAEAWVAGALSSKVTLGEAERRGAEQMREACAIISDSLGGKIDERDPDEVVLAANSISLAIRLLPLPNESKP